MMGSFPLVVISTRLNVVALVLVLICGSSLVKCAELDQSESAESVLTHHSTGVDPPPATAQTAGATQGGPPIPDTPQPLLQPSRPDPPPALPAEHTSFHDAELDEAKAPMFKDAVMEKDSDSQTQPDKRFMKGFEAYLQRGSSKRDDLYDPEKRFIKGMDAYFQKGKRDEQDEVVSEPEKKFMKGVGSYRSAGKKDTFDDSVPEAGKRFMKGVGAYISGGQKDAVADTNKRFIKGVDAYINAGKKNTGVVLAPEKKFIRGVNAYIQSAKPLSAPPQKKFIRGIGAYLNPRDGEKQAALNNPYKKSADGLNDDVGEEHEEAVQLPAKKFIRGVDTYIQAGKKDANEPVARPQKKFLRGVNAYLRAANRDLEKASGPEVKRFMRGMNWYINQYRAAPQAKRDNGYPFESQDADSMANAAYDGSEKRFMKGFEHYIKKSDIENESWDNENDIGGTPMDKKFIRGIDTYLQRNGDYGATAAESDKRNTKDSAVHESKRFLKGFGHYLKQRSSSDKRSQGFTDPDSNDESLESEPNSGEKRFLKGYNMYLHHLSQPSEHPDRVKRSTLEMDNDDFEQLDKRFLRGQNPYLQLYANRLSNEKRFIKIPHLFGPSQPIQRPQSMDAFKRSDAEDEDGIEITDKGKRFLRGIDQYLSSYLNSRPTKRFMKGVNPYIQAYSMSLGSKRFFPYKVDKRFMKGINPYLQSFYSDRGGKRLSSYDLEDTDREKRFLKGVNPYIKAYSSRVEDKRFVDDDDAFLVDSPEKRFLRGAGPYLSYYINRPNTKRVLRNEQDNDELYDEPDLNDVITTNKRFLRGSNPYMRDYITRQSYKRLPALQKRFMRGIDQYLQAYVNQPQDTQWSPGSVGKRFIKNYGYYRQLYNQWQKDEDQGPSLKSLSSKRPKRDTDSDGARDKRFMKGINQYLRAYASRVPDKRFLKGMNYYLNSLAKDKRFLKGVGPYLQNLGITQPDKRGDQSDHSTTETDEMEDKQEGKEGQQEHTRSKRSTDFINSRRHVPERSRSKRSSIPFFGLTGDFATKTDTSTVKSKRFIRGPNLHLKDVSILRSGLPKSPNKDIRTVAGDALVKEMAKESSADSSSEFSRQPYESRSLVDGENDQWSESMLPLQVARRFMVWNNGDYNLG